MSIHSKPEIDSDDFTELLIKNLARNPEVFRLALQYKLCGDDFVVNDTYGVQIYRHLVDCIMHVGCSPVAADVLLPYVDRKFKDNELVLSQYDEVCELVNYIYTKEELNEKEQKETPLFAPETF